MICSAQTALLKIANDAVQCTSCHVQWEAKSGCDVLIDVFAPLTIIDVLPWQSETLSEK